MNPRLSRAALWFCPLFLASSTCRGPRRAAEEGARNSADDLPTLSITHFTERTELFVEFRALVRGQDSPFAAHRPRTYVV